MLVLVTGSMLVNTGLIFINNQYAFTALRFLAGAFAHGGVVVAYVYVMEFVGPDSRSWVCNHYLNFFSVGYALWSLAAYFSRDWHYMQIWVRY